MYVVIPPALDSLTVYAEFGSGLPLGPLRRMVRPGDPVKEITGLPLLVCVSSAPVSVSSEISMGLVAICSSTSVTVTVTI